VSTTSIVLPPGGGRAYDLGPMRGVFKADGPETEDRYCVSEWAVEPGRSGPGPHHHEANEEVFLVTGGDDVVPRCRELGRGPGGTFLRIPAGVIHDFENRSDERAVAFNVFIPGGFEAPFRAWFETDRAGSG